MDYHPRRSSARWSTGAPEYVLACYDNGGRSCDRYTILFGGSFWDASMGRTVHYLGLSDNPNSPQGFSQFGEMPAHNRSACGRHVAWMDLPEIIRKHIIARATAD